MRPTPIAAIALGTLLLGGCANHRQTHVFVPGVEARDWWYPTTDRNLGRFVQSDEVGRVAWAEEDIPAWGGHSTLAASDALGGASFYDTEAYVQAIRLERNDAVATVPSD